MIRIAAVLGVVVLLTGASAVAQGVSPSNDLLPLADSTQEASLPPLDGETHPALRLTPDKSELVRLDREASSVIVGNPAHATVMLDTPRLAVVIPREAGATYFTALDKAGNVIMQRHVIVAAPKKNYIRVRRNCNAAGSAGNGRTCEPTSVYFCPDMCHEITGNSGENSGR